MYLKPEWLVCLLSTKVHQKTRTCSKFAEKVTGVRPSQFPSSLCNNVEASQREGLWLKRIPIGQLCYTIRERDRTRNRVSYHRSCCDVWQVYITSWLVMPYSLLTGGMSFWKALSLYFKVFAMNKWAQHKWTYVSSGGATWLLDLFSCSCISVTVFTHLVWSEIHSNTLLVAGTVQQVCVCVCMRVWGRV